jgi:Fur family ferric uptake transcriptional regulator
MRLNEMREGQKGKIVRVGGEIRLRRRILEMGLTRGSEIYVEKYAPLKDPLELVVRGNHISLRVNEAAEIDVEAAEPARA